MVVTSPQPVYLEHRNDMITLYTFPEAFGLPIVEFQSGLVIKSLYGKYILILKFLLVLDFTLAGRK